MANLSYLVLGLAILSTHAAQASSHVCKLDGKEIDLYGSDRGTRNGVVTCIRKFDEKTTQIEKHTYRNGKRIEESIDSPTRKSIQRYTDEGSNEWRHGEQLEYFPGTDKVKSRQFYKRMHQIGLQESFYENGEIKERQFYAQDAPDRGGSQTASIGYGENGDVQFIRCSKSRETTIDPKLCGFSGKSTVVLKDDAGEVRHRFVFNKGEKVESESPDSKQAGRIKREKTSTGEKLTSLFPNGKTKRVSLLNERSQMHGEDTEYFESGKLFRKTIFEKSKGLRSECWWENGKPKAKIERDREIVRATLTWDTGVIETSGSYSVPNDHYGNDDDVTEFMLRCEREYGLLKEGPFEAKRRDGTLEWAGTFKKGRTDGWHKSFDQTGLLEREEKFLFEPSSGKRDVRLLERKTYDKGILVKSEKFNSDGSIDDSKP